MPRNPSVFRLETDDPKLQVFADRIRDFLNAKRIVVRKVDPSLLPIEGELTLTTEGRLLYYVFGKYEQLFPPVLPPEKDEVPDWVEEHFLTIEAQLIAARIPPEDWNYYGGF